MEENNNVQEATSNVNLSDTKKVNSFYLIISWLIIFLLNSFTVYLGLNYAFFPVFHLGKCTFIEAILLYSMTKTMIRGFLAEE